MPKVLLFNPAGALSVYDKSKVKVAVPKLPSMSLAMVAGAFLEEGAEARVVDLALGEAGAAKMVVEQEIAAYKPDIVAVTATTPLFYEAASIGGIAKSVSKDIRTILGGPHASSLAFDCLKESSFDLVVCGEGEGPSKAIARGGSFRELAGGHCRDCPPSPEDKSSEKKAISIPIDDLPFPALNLFNSREYVCSRVISRKNPVGPIEISRGCVSNCSFCNKTVHGRLFRIKSAGRVVEELRILKKLGYREFHVLDDQFTTDIKKAKEICESIIRADIAMPWNLRTGVRVDRIDREFLSLAKRSGCYQMGVGFESGSQECLDAVDKGITLQQAFSACSMIKKSGIELAGFFMLGLPEETEETMRETIRFAIRLNPDYAKATVLVPFPGTRVYEDFEKKGLIKTRDWARYNFHNASEIYQHPSLSWEILNRYYNKFHRDFYFRFSFLTRRLLRSLAQGRLCPDIYYGYRTFFEKTKKTTEGLFNPEFFEEVGCNFCQSGPEKASVIYEADVDKIPRTHDEFMAIYSSASTEVFYERLLRCRSCGLIYLSPRPKMDIVIKGYSSARDEEYISQERGRLVTFRKSVSLIKKFIPSGKLLDVGAASGIFVKAAQEAGYEAYGIEPSSWLCEVARRRYGVTVFPGTVESVKLEKGSFDVITMFDALEHVPDPLATLNEVRKMLKPGGILVVNYPDISDPLAVLFGRKWWFLLSVHLFYFTPGTLSAYMDKTGFRKLLHKPYIQRLEYQYLVKRMSVYSKALAAIAKIPYVIPGFRDLLVPYFASQYLMISRKEK